MHRPCWLIMKQPIIIFEDDQILVINKPSGLVVNRAETVKEQTLQDWIERKTGIFKKLRKDNNFNKRSGVVHRLDKDTSGLMVIAKTAQSFADLQQQFKQRKVKKKYLALVHGRLEPRSGDIKLPLGRKPQDRRKFIVRLKGRQAVTEYQVKEYLRRGEEWFSLVELDLKTGRTHQIRVHLRHLGHSLVTDRIYLGRQRFKKDQKWCPRLFLHASYLSFFHPKTGQQREFYAELPERCEKIKRTLAK